jgi:hypothetical protein
MYWDVEDVKEGNRSIKSEAHGRWKILSTFYMVMSNLIESSISGSSQQIQPAAFFSPWSVTPTGGNQVGQ